MIGRVSAPRSSRLFAHRRWEGASAVVCASLMPLVVLGLAVATDYAKVSHFRSRVQLAADAASLAAAETAALHPENNIDGVASQSATAVFVRKAPHGAGDADHRGQELPRRRDCDRRLRRVRRPAILERRSVMTQSASTLRRHRSCALPTRVQPVPADGFAWPRADLSS